MKSLSEILHFIGGISLLIRDIISELKSRPYYFHLFMKQVYEIGWRSIPIVFVTAATVGMVLAMQFGLTLEKYGAKIYSPKVLGVTVFRELGPVFTSLILAGRVGASITAEIGSMKITQQIDALSALGTSPIKRIVTPCFLGGLVAIPQLCLFSCLVSVLFGALIGQTEININFYYYIHKVMASTKLHDWLSGYIKTYFFSGFITLTACYFGLQVSRGTYEVGVATTKSVVFSSVLIILGDYLITKISFMLWFI